MNIEQIQQFRLLAQRVLSDKDTESESAYNTLRDALEFGTWPAHIVQEALDNLCDYLWVSGGKIRGRRLGILFAMAEEYCLHNGACSPDVDSLIEIFYLLNNRADDNTLPWLANLLLLLPFTHNRRYINFAEQYTEHPRDIVRENAQRAIKRLG